jgi:hypothetical protein
MAKAKGEKKTIPEKVCVVYTRVLSTQEAIGQCKSRPGPDRGRFKMALRRLHSNKTKFVLDFYI